MIENKTKEWALKYLWANKIARYLLDVFFSIIGLLIAYKLSNSILGMIFMFSTIVFSGLAFYEAYKSFKGINNKESK